jgi:hypothetical protein
VLLAGTRLSKLSIWVPFVLISVLTPVINHNWAWRLSGRWTLRFSLGLLALFFAALVLWRVGPKPWAVAAVIIGLLVGQWWFFETAIILAFFKWRGFAP